MRIMAGLVDVLVEFEEPESVVELELLNNHKGSPIRHRGISVKRNASLSGSLV